MRSSIAIILAAALVAGCQTTETVGPGPAPTDIPFIDAHSQVDHNTDIEKVVPLMDRAGVARTILSTRFQRSSADVVAYAARFPDRITAAVKTKTKHFMKGRRGFPRVFLDELAQYEFGAMPEIILWHAQKGNRAGQAIIPPDDQRVQVFLDVAREKGWPVIPHIEFASAGADRAPFMDKLESVMAANRDLSFALIHMGQLDAAETARLIAAHPNVHFLTSHCNPVSARNNQPWSNLFSGNSLKPEWRTLITENPDRFILAFDNVFPEQWGSFFLEQVAVWRRALAELPEAVAHAIAHRNAERLWRLPPVDK